jgi:hypothetical protein
MVAGFSPVHKWLGVRGEGLIRKYTVEEGVESGGGVQDGRRADEQ